VSDELIHPDLVEVALDRATGTVFERFVNAFYPGLAGINFVPLGGIHDGGADAVQSQSLWAETKPGIFYQASIQKDHRVKIKQTVQRLREVGRTPTALYFVTSQKISRLDAKERLLSEETGVSIRIHGRAYIAAQVNDSLQTRTAFRTAMTEAGVSGFRFHDLRHCAATNLRRAGVDTTTAMQIVGHTSPQMWKRYNHIQESDLIQAAKKLGKFLEGNTPGTLDVKAERG
jgi:integrase-like protein